MTQRLSPRGFMAVALCAALFITGCANNSASNQSNYAQRSDDVEAIDTTIEREVDDALKRADARLGDARIRAHSYNGVVLLVGQVPSEELRDMAVRLPATYAVLLTSTTNSPSPLAYRPASA